jgi:sialic acid synthase SpsE
MGDLATVVAVSCGATIIEKHFTLNKFTKGADHKISLEPKEFKLMVKKIRTAEKMMGQKIYKFNSKIKKKKNIFLRFITAKKKIKKGEVLSFQNIGFLRHVKRNSGLEPKYFFNLRNKKSKTNMKKGQIFTKGYLLK